MRYWILSLVTHHTHDSASLANLLQILTANEAACLLLDLTDEELSQGTVSLQRFIGQAWIPLRQHIADPYPDASSKACEITVRNVHSNQLRENEQGLLVSNNSNAKLSPEDVVSPDFVVIDLDGRKSSSLGTGSEDGHQSLVEYYVESKDVLGLSTCIASGQSQSTPLISTASCQAFNITHELGSEQNTTCGDDSVFYNYTISNGHQADNIPESSPKARRDSNDYSVFIPLQLKSFKGIDQNLVYNGQLVDLHTADNQIVTTSLWMKALPLETVCGRERNDIQKSNPSILPNNRLLSNAVLDSKTTCSASPAFTDSLEFVTERKENNPECKNFASLRESDKVDVGRKFLAVFEAVDCLIGSSVVKRTGTILSYGGDMDELVTGEKSLNERDKCSRQCESAIMSQYHNRLLGKNLLHFQPGLLSAGAWEVRCLINEPSTHNQSTFVLW